jgi:hypothetical protein
LYINYFVAKCQTIASTDILPGALAERSCDMRPAPHVRANVSDDGLILMDIRSGQIFSANPIGARIWSGIEQGHSLSAIVQSIISDTGVDAAIVERDATEFVKTLTDRTLIDDAWGP